MLNMKDFRNALDKSFYIIIFQPLIYNLHAVLEFNIKVS